VKNTSSVNANNKRHGGRPSQAAAARIRGQILDVAADLFFTQGYGAVSVEAIARRAHISKRTFYVRFRDKSDLFGAVVHHIIDRLRPTNSAQLFSGKNLVEVLLNLAQVILRAALTPQALALHRLILAEATRFPELAAVMNEAGARKEAIAHIAALLEKEIAEGKLKLTAGDSVFAAEQFLQLIVSAPQRRAMGLGEPLTPEELDGWARNSVRLFLHGCGGATI
jgi:TetR/AcrR family transcriptional repressor of mexJK operon